MKKPSTDRNLEGQNFFLDTVEVDSPTLKLAHTFKKKWVGISVNCKKRILSVKKSVDWNKHYDSEKEDE